MLRPRLIESLSDRRAAIAPILILGVTMALAHLIQGGGCNVMPAWRVLAAQAFGLAVSAVIVYGGIRGVLRRLPVWSYAWAGISIIGFIGLLNIFGSEQAIYIPEFIEIAAALTALGFGLTVFVVILLRGWDHSAFYGMTLASTFALVMLLFAANLKGPYWINYIPFPAGALLASVMYCYTGASSGARRIAAMVVAFLLNALITLFAAHHLPLNNAGGSDVIYLLVLLAGISFTGSALSMVVGGIKRISGKRPLPDSPF